jgi:hypothetical protein
LFKTNTDAQLNKVELDKLKYNYCQRWRFIPDGVEIGMRVPIGMVYALCIFLPESDNRLGEITKGTSSSPKMQFKPRASSSPIFTGRESHLMKLRAFFGNESDKPRDNEYLTKFGSPPGTQAREPLTRKCFLLYGMGGAGKTQICLKFTEESSDL